MKRIYILMFVLVLPVLMLANAILGSSKPRPVYAPNIVKVQLTEDALTRTNLPEEFYSESSAFGLPELDRIMSQYGKGKVIRAHIRLNDRTWEKEYGVNRWFLVKYAAGINVAAAVKAFAANKYVETAIPEFYAYTQAIPNDTFYPNNWGHNNTAQLPVYQGGSHSGPGVGTIGFDSNAQAAWDDSQGYGSAAIIIAVIDTGVDTAHPDLRLVAGYDYGDNDSNPMDNSADPGHGTSCSGVTAGRGNNGLGVTGMAAGCSVMPLKIADSSGSLGFTAIENALYHCGNNNVDVASMSFGAEGGMAEGDSPSTDNAMEYAYSNGTVLFVATANSNTSTIAYPSNHNKAISVGAASPTGQRKSTTSSDGENWWGSNYGTAVQDAKEAVDIMAPTILPATDLVGSVGYSTTDYYMWFNGTSCATPYAAGVAGLLLSKNPSLTPAQVRAAITSNATDMTIDGGAGWDRYTGYGMVNAEAALASLTPGMPTCDITAPLDGAQYNLGDVVTVNVSATDPATRSINRVDFYLDSAEIPIFTDYSSPYSWTWDTSGTTGGSHTIRATAVDDESNAVSDQVTIAVLVPADEGFETGNFSAFPWVLSGNGNWTVQTAEKYSGVYAAKSGAIGDSQSTTMALSLNITTAGNISFYQKTSSESEWDFLKFYIDNVEMGSWSGAVAWTMQSYAVSTGTHEFKWTYSKDTNTVAGSDCAWVDHIAFPPFNSFYAPSNLTGIAGNNTVQLNWLAPGGNTPSGYKIYKNSALLTTTNLLAYTDNAVVNGITYSYYVVATYTAPDGESAPSNTVAVTPNDIVETDAVIVGGTSATGTQTGCPINIYYKSLHGQSVYTAAELNAAGVYGPINITRMGFYINTLPTLALPNFLVRMKHTTASNVASWISATDMQTVYTNAAYMPTAGGYEMLTLSTPFLWNGTDNLVVDTAFGLVANWSATGTVRYINTTNGYRYARNDDNDQTNVFSGGSATAYRPNLKLTVAYIPTAPSISVYPTSLDYGMVLVNTTTSNSFEISNPGNAILSGSITTPAGYTVALGRGSADGTSVLLTKAAATTKDGTRNTLAFSVNAGSANTYEVSFAPTEQQAYNGDIVISHNAAGGDVYVSLTGQGGQPSLGLSADTISAEVGYGQSGNRTLTVSNAGNMPLSYSLSISGTVPWLTINGGTSVSNTIASGGAAQDITFAFDATGLAYGTYNATIDGTSNDPANSNYSIAVALTVLSPITIISPAGGEIWQSGSTQSIIWNYSGGGTAATLFYSSNGGANWAIIEGYSMVQGTNSIDWVVPYLASTNYQIRIRENVDPYHNEYSNPFTVIKPNISLSTTSLAFGMVIVNSIATNNFTITNSGTATLTGSITTPAGYSVALARSGDIDQMQPTLSMPEISSNDNRNNLPYSIPNGSNAMFTVSFTPTAVQAYNGSISITHNAGGANRTISLTGQGGKPVIGISSLSFTDDLAPGGSAEQYVILSNTGNMNLEYALTLSDSPSWLTIDGGTEASGMIEVGAPNVSITLAFNAINLSPGVYDATLQGTSNDPDIPVFEITAQLTVLNPLALLSPAGGEIWETGSQQLIAWNYSGTGTEISLLYSLNGGANWLDDGILPSVSGLNEYLWSVPANASAICLIKLVDSVLPNVEVISNQFSITNPVPPSAPDNLTITHDPVSGDITLTWDASSGDPSGYLVYRSSAPDFAPENTILVATRTSAETWLVIPAAETAEKGFYRVIAYRD